MLGRRGHDGAAVRSSRPAVWKSLRATWEPTTLPDGWSRPPYVGGGGVLFECEHLCLRVLDRHVFVVDGDILRPFPAQAEHKMSNTCLRTCAGSGRALKGFIVQEVQKMLQKTWLHMKPSIHLNLTSIQPELAVLLRPAAPPPLSSSSLQPAAGLETE